MRDYSLASELAKLCLPGADKDENRKLAFACSVCFAVLIIGLAGLRQPATRFTARPTMMDAVPVVYVPLDQPTQPQTETALQPENLREVFVTTPQIIPVVAPNLTDAAFPVPIKEPSVVAKPPQFSAVPSNANQQSAVIRPNAADGIIRPNLVYPPDARRVRAQGTTLLEIVVAANGKPASVKLKDSTGHDVLDKAAIEWVKKWLWPPGEIRYYFVPIDFQLK